uniref:Uncharacterized protein n=1 Tax=Bionectria ochroleuca TaxID=29856 RepID=A0A8H7TR95_BIOOC
MNDLEELTRNTSANMWQLRFLKKLFPRPGNPGLKLFLYEVEQIHKYMTAPIAKKLVEASEPGPNRPATPSFAPVPIKIAEDPATPSFTPAPIKIAEDEEAACTMIARMPERPPVPTIVLTTPGGQVVPAQNMPAWRKIEIPFHYRLKLKREQNNDKWLSPALCRRLRKKIRRRQMQE